MLPKQKICEIMRARCFDCQERRIGESERGAIAVEVELLRAYETTQKELN